MVQPSTRIIRMFTPLEELEQETSETVERPTRIIRMFTPPEELGQKMTSKGKPKKVGKSKRRKRGL